MDYFISKITYVPHVGPISRLPKFSGPLLDIPEDLSEYQEIQVIHRQLQRVKLIKRMTGTLRER